MAENAVVDAHGKSVTRGRFIAVAGAIMATWTGLHVALLGALAAGAVPGGWWTFGGAYLLALLAIARLLLGVADRVYPSAATRIFVLRPFWYAQVSFLVLTPVGGLAFLLGLPFGRGLAFAHGALGVAALVLVAFFVSGYAGSRRLVVRDLQLSFPGLPAPFDGFKVAQLSDLHVGPHTSRRYLRRIARAVEAASPDLVAYTGDQVDDFDRDVAYFVEAFGHLRGHAATIAIAGNHDIYAGWAGVRRGLEEAKIRVLVNEAEAVERGGERIWIAGTGDPAGTQWGVEGGRDAAPDIARTLAATPTEAFVLALAHNPALWPALAERGVALTLSGHTHHGQLSIPSLNWSLAGVFLKHAHGTYREGDSFLYVNPGTNFWGLPLRLGAWPEVTIVTLRRASS